MEKIKVSVSVTNGNCTFDYLLDCTKEEFEVLKRFSHIVSSLYVEEGDAFVVCGKHYRENCVKQVPKW